MTFRASCTAERNKLLVMKYFHFRKVLLSQGWSEVGINWYVLRKLSWFVLLVLFSAESYEESQAFLCHWSKVIEFCIVVGTLNLVRMASRLSGYWSSANSIDSFDYFICGSALIDCNNRRICLAVIVGAIIAVLLCTTRRTYRSTLGSYLGVTVKCRVLWFY